MVWGVFGGAGAAVGAAVPQSQPGQAAQAGPSIGSPEVGEMGM